MRRSGVPASTGHRDRHRSRCLVGEPSRSGARCGSAGMLVDAHSRCGRPHARNAGSVFQNAREPDASRFRSDGAHDAACRHRNRTAACGKRAAGQRKPLSPAVRQRDGRRLQLNRRRPLRLGEPGTGANDRTRFAERDAHAADGNDLPPSARTCGHPGCARTRWRGPQRRIPVATCRRHHAHGHRKRACNPGRAWPVDGIRRHDLRYQRAQARRNRDVPGEGEGAGHAAVDRGCRDHDRCGRSHRVSQSRGRGSHRLAFARSLRTAAGRCDRHPE